MEANKDDLGAWLNMDFYPVNPISVTRYASLVKDFNMIHHFDVDSINMIRSMEGTPSIAAVNAAGICLDDLLNTRDIRITHGYHAASLGHELLPEEYSTNIVFESTTFRNPLVVARDINHPDMDTEVLVIARYVRKHDVDGEIFHEFSLERYLPLFDPAAYGDAAIEGEDIVSITENSILLNEQTLIVSESGSVSPEKAYELATMTKSRATLDKVHSLVDKSLKKNKSEKLYSLLTHDIEKEKVISGSLALLSECSSDFRYETHQLKRIGELNSILGLGKEISRHHHYTCRAAGALVRLLGDKSIASTDMVYLRQDFVIIDPKPSGTMNLCTAVARMRSSSATFYQVFLKEGKIAALGYSSGGIRK